MDTRRYSSQLTDAVYRSSRWMAVAIMLAVSNLGLLAMVYLQQNDERVILLPPKLEQEVWVHGHEVSDSYLEQMAVYATELFFSYHPENVHYRVQQFLRYTDPAAYSTLSESLHRDADSIKRNDVSAVFYPKEVRLRPEQRQAIVTGTQTRMVGGKSMAQRQLSVLVSFSGGSSFLITQMHEVEEDALDPFVVMPDHGSS